LNQRRTPPPELQVSVCSTFRIMCDVPGMAVFCSKSIDCFPGMALFHWLELLLIWWHTSCSTFVVSPYISSFILAFLLSFAWHLCPLVLSHLSVCTFSLFCFNYYIWPICRNFSTCVCPLST
jgi:hypothetical protein